jgi:propanediol utilization protein
LSQPGEFLSDKRVKLVTPVGELPNVAVLGPVRDDIQVELSRTDTFSLGITVPVNLSGNLSGGGDVGIVGDAGMLFARGAAIVAKAHIHMPTSEMARFGVSHGQSVKVAVGSERPVIFKDVVVRVGDRYDLAMHIDSDEANSCCLGKETEGRIVDC